MLTDFSGVTIFTGNNNSGKTSVLELLQTLKNPLGLRTWVRNGRMGTIPLRTVSRYEALSDLFNVAESENRLAYSVTDANGSVHTVSVEAKYKTVQKTEKAVRRDVGMALSRKHIDIEDEMDAGIDVSEMYFRICCDGKSSVYKISEYARLLPSEKEIEESICPVVNYISPTRHADSAVYLNEVLDNPQLYGEMLAVLRDFDSDILSINVAQRSEFSSFPRTYYTILSQNMNKALPLNMYGDGMKKAILLMSAVVASKGGILLIDEFETAIHASVMADVFGWIIATCKKLDVQLFLTTHSIEAIQTVLRLDSSLTDDIALYTLYREHGESSVRRLSAKDALKASESLGLELR